MKKITVVKERCIGCGACVAIDPDHFEFNEEGQSNPITNDQLESEALKNAIESCPTSAIEITEATEECKCNEGEKCICGEDCTCETDCNCHEDENCTCEECECHHTEENEASN